MAEKPKKKPQDHKPKKKAEDKPEARPDEPFEFEHDGKAYTLAVPAEVLTAGFARRTRHLDLASQFFEMLELLADEKTLAAVDEMQRDEFNAFQRSFYEHIGVELGE